MIRKIMLLCFLPLLVGGLSYLFFRKNGLLGISLRVSDFEPTLFWRSLIDTIPDFCWSFSLSNALYLLFVYYHASFLKSSALIVSLVLFSEIIQVFFPHHFTFDVWDLFVDLIAVLIAAISQRHLYENKKRT